MSDITEILVKSLGKSDLNSKKLTLLPDDHKRLMNLCGRFDEHLRQIEKRLGVELNNRGNHFQILGDKQNIKLAHDLLIKLYEETEKNHELTPRHIHLAIQDYDLRSHAQSKNALKQSHKPFIEIPIKDRYIKAKSHNQDQYIQNIVSHDMIFGIGPAGTGKTYLAVACAVKALEEGTIQRILLTRPVVEAGEKLGFLPGDVAQKVDPYLRPLLDALYEMLGFERTAKMVERNIIEIAPLAYMRGRTLNDAFIILDEAQNTTVEQMKMFLTRLGFSSKAVITGDITQIDLAKDAKSGLVHASEILKNVHEIKFSYFDTNDVIRHPLVQRIVHAYQDFEDKQP